MRMDGKSFIIQFSRDRRLYLIIRYPKILRFLLRFFSLEISKPWPCHGLHKFNLEGKDPYGTSLEIEEFLKPNLK